LHETENGKYETEEIDRGGLAPFLIIMDNLSDEKLIALTAEGEDNAFRIIVDRYRDRIMNTAYKFTNEYDLAQDLSQEIFLKVWKHADTFRHDSALSTWIFRIAYNTAINFKNKNSKHNNADIDLINPKFIAQDETAKRTNKRRIEKLKEEIADLPERQRMALILKHFEGYSYSEIAEIMKTTQKAVENLLYRARETLRKSRGELL